MTTDIRSLADARTMPTYARLPVTFVRGEGARLVDDAGKEYLDFVAGIAVNGLGHSHPAVMEAIAEQSHRLIHTSNLYYTQPMAELADRLCRLLGWEDGRVFFANSGAEANECALKLIRRWDTGRLDGHRPGTIAALGSFHGRTMTTLAATGQPAKWKPFRPVPPGFTHVEFDNPQALEDAVTGSESAVMLEPVQGEGGVIVPSDGYLPAVRQICDRHGMAMFLDEVQTGLGRTGTWFAFQHSGAVPDVITLAKALGNGLPAGACIARGELATAFQAGDHGTTMGGNPLVCAVSLAVLDVLERDRVVENAARMGEYLKGRLNELVGRHEAATEVRGLGLLLAVQLDAERSKDVTLACLKRGLVVNNVTPSAVRMSPPLIVTESDCDQAVAILDEALEQVLQGQPA
ncbi:MAG TPA: acetylornithine transaminase [Actinomycetota bacterium]|nr:acetylornithine transaminase [Actinomycetota bacterium]